MANFQRNTGTLPPVTIASLLWDDVADTAQFFYTFPTETELLMDPQVNMPASNLQVRRHLLSANMHIASMDTPQRWLPPPIQRYTNSSGNESGRWGPPSTITTNTSSGTTISSGAFNRNNSQTRNGATIVSESSVDSASRVGHGKFKWDRTGDGQSLTGKRTTYGAGSRNTDMHPVLEKLMLPMMTKSIPWKLDEICRAAKLESMTALPSHNHSCYRWMLGRCDSDPSNPHTCGVRNENNHLTATQIPNDYAIKLAQVLQPGIDQLVAESATKRPRHT